MNKEEAKQKLHNLAFAKLNTKPDDLKLADVMRIVNQIYEPQKPVVSQMVADIIEYYKSQCAPIIDVFEEKYSNEQYRKWLINEPNAYDIVALAWFFGYEVEKEKRYRVNVKNVRTRQGTLNRSKRSGRFIFSNPEENNLYDTKFTRKELEDAGFGWVFDCEGVEVEEV